MSVELVSAIRSLRRHRAHGTAAALTLALGIAATTAVFSVVEGVLLRSLPFPHADRLVDIKSRPPVTSGSTGDWQSPPFSLFDAWRGNAKAFEAMAAISMFDSPVLLSRGPAERVQAPHASAEFFALLGATPELGRLMTQDDDMPGAAAVAVLAHRFWMSRFGGQHNVVGQTLTLDTLSYTIVGVTTAEFQSSVGPQANADLWLSLGPRLATSNTFPVTVVGRLTPGVTPDAARVQLDAITATEWVPGPRTARQLVAAVTPLRAVYVGRHTEPLLTMLAAVGVVLLIACSNAGTLLVARTVERSPSLAIKLALGARQSHLVRQVLAEGAVIAVVASLGGLIGAAWLVRLLITVGVAELPAAASISINARVLAASFAVALVTGLVASVAPTVLVRRTDVADLLRSSGLPGFSPVRSMARMHNVSVAAQATLTLVLLTAAGLTGRSFLRMVTLDLGFEPKNVVTGFLELRGPRYASMESRATFITNALAQLHTLRELSGVSLATGVPLHGGGGGTVRIHSRLGQAREEGVSLHGVTSEYFQTLGIPLLRGTTLTEAGSIKQVVVNHAAARLFFPSEDPLGAEVTLLPGTPLEWTGTIVGVVQDTRTFFQETPPPVIYYPLPVAPLRVAYIVVKAGSASVDLRHSLREAVHATDPAVAVEDVTAMTDRLSLLLGRQRFYGLVLAAFALLALALAATGMFASTSYSVSRRTRELGLRVALGAQRRKVVGLVIGQALRPAVTGIALGLPLTLVTTRALRSLLFEVEPGDPAVLVLTTVLFLAVCVLAGYLPARRSAALDPMTAMRAE